MTANPSEIVVLWLSKHGSSCDKGNQQYPNVTVAGTSCTKAFKRFVNMHHSSLLFLCSDKQAFWTQITSLFGPLLIDTSATPPKTTRVDALLERGSRLLVLATDWMEFTNSSPLALDSCAHLENNLPDMLSAAGVSQQMEIFSGMAARRAHNAARGIFTLVSLAASAPGGTCALCCRA